MSPAVCSQHGAAAGVLSNAWRPGVLTSTGSTEPSYSRLTTATVTVETPCSSWTRGWQEEGRREERAEEGREGNGCSGTRRWPLEGTRPPGSGTTGPRTPPQTFEPEARGEPQDPDLRGRRHTTRY
ncbi:hypothetical protein EYF80_028637 [Liparis tanakae]|uniref:Uncharacterized protein n=1 Tax=Liparis tanakae TaxID=230148 RepID=A0A4Z2H5Q2_9TELE|nr:hypothetical protein EYF80_028637 [Liparis tanakae]